VDLNGHTEEHSVFTDKVADGVARLKANKMTGMRRYRQIILSLHVLSNLRI